MEESIEITILYDIYGKLLTLKQQGIFEEYYLYNLSLREIAQNRDISYQAVRDSIKSSEKMLKDFEKNIGMSNLKNKINTLYDTIKSENNIHVIKDEVRKIIGSEDDI